MKSKFPADVECARLLARDEEGMPIVWNREQRTTIAAMTLVWNREQRATIATIKRRRLPGAYMATYAPREIEIVRREATRARVCRRQRLARQLAIAIGWYAS